MSEEGTEEGERKRRYYIAGTVNSYRAKKKEKIEKSI